MSVFLHSLKSNFQGNLWYTRRQSRNVRAYVFTEELGNLCFFTINDSYMLSHAHRISVLKWPKWQRDEYIFNSDAHHVTRGTDTLDWSVVSSPGVFLVPKLLIYTLELSTSSSDRRTLPWLHPSIHQQQVIQVEGCRGRCTIFYVLTNSQARGVFGLVAISR
jgi:hypothetical protein